ncbi:MAG: nuclear transport factor 2 family protein [Pseudomonadota bacterium]
MNNDHELIEQVRKLSDEAAIRQLVQQYCFVIDDHDIDGIAQCFCEDSRYRSEDGVFDVQGRDAIASYFRQRMASLGPSTHVAHGHVVTLDDADPDRAVGRVSSHAEVVVDGVPMITCVRYRDDYRREGGRWRFADRLMAFTYYCAVSDYVSIWRTLARKQFAGVTLDADYPEKLPGWSGQLPREP